LSAEAFLSAIALAAEEAKEEAKEEATEDYARFESSRDPKELLVPRGVESLVQKSPRKKNEKKFVKEEKESIKQNKKIKLRAAATPQKKNEKKFVKEKTESNKQNKKKTKKDKYSSAQRLLLH
jgi:hypothetical protein